MEDRINDWRLIEKDEIQIGWKMKNFLGKCLKSVKNTCNADYKFHVDSLHLYKNYKYLEN
jgi:hypothetical protein